MGLITTTLKVVLFAYLSKSIYLYLSGNGVAIYHNNVHPGKCRIVPDISCGSEQIAVTKDGLAFITSGHRDLTNCNPEYIQGNLYTFDFNNPEQNSIRLKIISSSIDSNTFEPHGMDIVKNADKGTVTIFVVNHANGKETIEVLVYSKKAPSEIVHTKTIENEKFVCLNDIAVIDENTFYVTNYVKYCHTSKLLMTAELLLRLKTGNLVFYQNGETKIVVNDLIFNGVTLSKDHKQVVAVENSAKELQFFDRNEANGDLILSNKAYIGHNGDNVYLDKQTGHYYVAYFKNPFTIHPYSLNKTSHSSSGAVKIIVEGKDKPIDVKEVFYDRGEHFVSVASSFVHYKGHYLVGTVFDKLGYCKKE